MPNTLVLELVKGTSRDFQMQALASDGSTPTGLLDTDTLATKVFSGDGQSVLLTPGTTWISAASGTFQISFNNADTVSWATAVYKLVTTATRGGRSGAICNASLSLLPNSGTGTPPSTYCELADMLVYAPWLSKLQDEVSDFTGFLKQRADARTWLENIIQKHYRLTAGTGLTTFGNPVVSFGPRRQGSDNVILQGYLDQNMLMTAAPKRVIEITSKYAIGLVCQAQITSTDAKSSFYQQRADWFLGEANNAVLGYIAEIDINDDGYPEYVIPCGTSDALWG